LGLISGRATIKWLLPGWVVTGQLLRAGEPFTCGYNSRHQGLSLRGTQIALTPSGWG